MQISSDILICQAQDFVVCQGKSQTHWYLKSLDIHVTYFYLEGLGENGDTIFVDTLEGLVLDSSTLKQDAYWRVSAKDKSFVKAEELTWCTLI